MAGSKDDLHPCRAYRLGILEYGRARDLQQHLARLRLQGEIDDTLLLLQHPPVITLGNAGKRENVRDPRALGERHIPIIPTDRGGDVTYHSPGQLVAYPILNLEARGLGVASYVWNLEEVAIRVLARSGIEAGRLENLRGVWIAGEKVCSLGVHISKGISTHGLALNVENDLTPFAFINPCGTGRPMTSMASILGRSPGMEAVESLTLAAFAEVFQSALREEQPTTLEHLR